jgi:hypothetical protein
MLNGDSGNMKRRLIEEELSKDSTADADTIETALKHVGSRRALAGTSRSEAGKTAERQQGSKRVIRRPGMLIGGRRRLQ